MDYTTGRTYYVNHMTRQTTWTREDAQEIDAGNSETAASFDAVERNAEYLCPVTGLHGSLLEDTCRVLDAGIGHSCTCSSEENECPKKQNEQE